MKVPKLNKTHGYKAKVMTSNQQSQLQSKSHDCKANVMTSKQQLSEIQCKHKNHDKRK